MLGLLISMFAYLLPRSGSPAAIEGSIPRKKLLDQSIAAGRREISDFGTACPRKKMFALDAFPCPWQSNSGTSIPADGRLDRRAWRSLPLGEVKVRLVSSHAPGQAGWQRHAWLLPAVLAAAVISLLCWGAWVYGYNPHWLDGSRAWWHPLLRTDQGWTLVFTVALLVAGLAAYWWPRRDDQPPIAFGLIAVVVLVLVAAV